MSETVEFSIIANNNLFEDWLSVTNQLIAVLATDVVTVNAGGGATTGNGFVTGTFGATTLVAGSLRGGNVSSSANLVLQSNLVSGNITINTTAIGVVTAVHSSINTNITTATALVDSWAFSNAVGAFYDLQVTDGQNGGFNMTHITIVTDSSVVNVTEYASLSTTGQWIGAFSANANTTTVNVWYTPNGSSNVFVKGERTLLPK